MYLLPGKEFKMKANRIALIFVLNIMLGKAQQTALFNTYSYDLMQLNIAAIGRTCVEANLNYRAQWLGVKETPRLYQLNAGMAFGNNHGLGVKVSQNTMGLLKFTSATLGYAYRVQLNDKSKLHLGIGAAWRQNSFNAAKALVFDNNDISLTNSQANLRSNNFDCEAGALFLGDKLTAGLSALHLYNTNSKMNAVTFETKPQLNAMLAYKFNKGKMVEVEPWLLNRYTVNGMNQPEAMVNVRFKQMITVGGGYRFNYGYMALAGFELGMIKLAYSFDYGIGKNAAGLGSSHQVLLGIDLCRKKTKVQDPEPVVEATKEPLPAAEPAPVAKEEPKKEEPVAEPVKQDPPVVATPVVSKEEDLFKEIHQISETFIFDLNKSTLAENKTADLDRVAKMVIDNKLKISITGYACNKGSEEYNKILSYKRAEYVKNELHRRGVSNAAMEIYGIGEEKELYSNSDSNLQIRNRTVRINKP